MFDDAPMDFVKCSGHLTTQYIFGMLTEVDIARINAEFGVYDHDWRFFSEFLGEPFLLENYLAYFDGLILYLCAFRLGGCWRELRADELQSLVNDFEFAEDVQAINVWGVYQEVPRALGVKQRVLPLAREVPRSEACDAMIDLDDFDFARYTSARLARNSAKNKGVACRVTQRETLSHRHTRLMEGFFRTHDISATHASFYLAANSLIKRNNVYIVEGWHGGKLIGFCLLSHAGVEAASIVMGFYDNAARLRVSDGIFSEAIMWAKGRGLRRLHVGYSGHRSLLDYKRKWGPLISLPPYGEAFYSASQEILAVVNRGNYPWRERILDRCWST